MASVQSANINVAFKTLSFLILSREHISSSLFLRSCSISLPWLSMSPMSDGFLVGSALICHRRITWQLTPRWNESFSIASRPHSSLVVCLAGLLATTLLPCFLPHFVDLRMDLEDLPLSLLRKFYQHPCRLSANNLLSGRPTVYICCICVISAW
jgi:hypothetical protein